jgi:hypothetical protein
MHDIIKIRGKHRLTSPPAEKVVIKIQYNLKSARQIANVPLHSLITYILYSHAPLLLKPFHDIMHDDFSSCLWF